MIQQNRSQIQTRNPNQFLLVLIDDNVAGVGETKQN